MGPFELNKISGLDNIPDRSLYWNDLGLKVELNDSYFQLDTEPDHVLAWFRASLALTGACL